MFYVTDTHALIWYVIGKLPKNIDKIFRQTEHGEYIIFIPTIVLAECKYLVEHKKIDLDFSELLRKIEISKNFIAVPFDFRILKLMSNEISDIHDQIIIATTKLLNGTLITKDEEIIKSQLVETVWK